MGAEHGAGEFFQDVQDWNEILVVHHREYDGANFDFFAVMFEVFERGNECPRSMFVVRAIEHYHLSARVPDNFHPSRPVRPLESAPDNFLIQSRKKGGVSFEVHEDGDGARRVEGLVMSRQRGFKVRHIAHAQSFRV